MGFPKKSTKSMPEQDSGKPSLALAFNVQRSAGKRKKMTHGDMPAPDDGSGMAKGGLVKGAQADANPGTSAKKPNNYRPPMTDYMNSDMDPSAQPKDENDDSMYPPESEFMDNNNRKRFKDGGSVDGQRVKGMEDDQSPGMDLYAEGGKINGFADYKESQNTNYPGTPGRKSDDERVDGYMNSEARTSAMSAPYPEDEKSIVDAIRAKRNIEIESDGNMYADGGKIPGDYNEGNIDWENGQSPYDPDNSEAYKKELYDDSQLSRQPHDSNLKGDDREMSSENEHDMGLVDRIRERMRNRRGF